jgi:methionine sulfoxide reductase catalytic subunit
MAARSEDMLIKKRPDLKYSDITPKKLYLRRREFITGSAALAACAVAAPLLGKTIGEEAQEIPKAQAEGGPLPQKPEIAKRSRLISPDEKVTPYQDAAGYTNFYEFSMAKRDPTVLARDFRTRPWTVAVEGLVRSPRQFSIDDLIRLSPLEERITRWRCVEGWSMVIPWIGYSLSELIKKCEPDPAAKFIEFTTLYDPEQMPGQKTKILKWPYVEGLRMDEAMHPLALLAVGMYEEYLPPQNGAPVRLVVPWKYGFKSIKSIVRIRFVDKMPKSAWMRANPEEYGFYANINPFVSHPRWSQATERRIGEEGSHKTIIFNGYEEEVGSLYAGMNLKRDY